MCSVSLEQLSSLLLLPAKRPLSLLRASKNKINTILLPFPGSKLSLISEVSHL